MKPYVSHRAYIPRAKFTRAMRRELTYRQTVADVVKMSAEHKAIWGSQQFDVTVLRAFAYKGKFVSVPRAWAIKKFGKDYFQDRTTSPKTKRNLTKIDPRDEKQRLFFQSIFEDAIQPGPRQMLANATTGSGKSVAAIRLGIMLYTPTLIVVDSNKIAAGFLRNFVKFFGKEWTEANVGRIQQGSCNYEGKAFCIAMVQSLMSRRYPSAVYSYFGLVVYDEVQVFGSSYHKALGMFKARVHVGMTATNKQGQFGTLVYDYLGTPAVVSKQEVLKPKAYIVRNRLDKLYNVYSDGTLINSLASDTTRNKLLTDIILQHGYKRNRVCLVLSDRVAQLQTLQKMLIAAGVKKTAVGLHVAEYEDTTYTVAYSYGTTQQKLDMRVTQALAKKMARILSSGDFDYAAGLLPVALEKKLKSGVSVTFSVVRNVIKPSEADLDYIANFCHIILATYKIFAKGVDYPRIDMGVEATPYGNVTQPLGRTLRLPDGFEKPQPEWYAIHDRFIMPPRQGFAADWEAQNNVAQAMNHFFDKKASTREKALLKAKSDISYRSGNSYRDGQ